MPNKKRRRRLDKEEAHIVIVGSGLAGLSAAISLEQAGFCHISLFERDDSLEQQKEGYGLTLTYNPKGPLASLGLLEQAANEDCPSRSHYLFRSDGSIMGYFGNAFSKTRGLGQRGNLRVPRKVLRKMLFQKLSTTNVNWGHHLTDYSWNEETNQYTVKFLKKKTDTRATDETDVTIATADLLVAADGIRSAVLKNLAQSQSKPANNPHVGLGPIGIRLILGIAEFTHPLLKERGFYTLDGKHRLFTMPYESNRFDSTKSNRIMWQLSLCTDGTALEDKENQSCERKVLDPASLQEYVLSICSKWHSPVEEMVRATPLNAVWGTDLMDRDPLQVQKLVLDSVGARRLVVVGDALHSMSPFKGQGANQALRDGPLLAHWLQTASIDSAVKSFWRETVQRTAAVVAASRNAARELHSPAIMKDSHGFAGVKSDQKENLLAHFQEKKIGAELGSELDNKVGEIIRLLNVGEEEQEAVLCEVQQKKALHFAATGDIQGLRQMSLDKHSASIRTAKNANCQTCLHLAAKGGHSIVCRWLLTEVECDPKAVDTEGRTPVEYCANDVSGAPASVFRCCLRNCLETCS